MEYQIDHERICRCALNRIFGFKPSLSIALVNELGSASAVFGLDRDSVDTLFGPYSAEKGLVTQESLEKAAGELERTARLGGLFIHPGDSCYPALLRECEDYPAGLYYLGSSPPEEVFSGKPFVSIVGTRGLSPYGAEWCERIVSTLARSEPAPCIVSGLALGTDICAHSSALREGIPTIAVMATGIDSIYPHANRPVAEKICRSPQCALVSDYPLGTEPLRINFLRRNRIIAGLSKATILVESKIKGGGMTTARLANSYGRDTFALPGRVDDPYSIGCNRLIADKTAESISDCSGLADALGLDSLGTTAQEDLHSTLKRRAGYLSAERIRLAADILLEIKKRRGISLEELAAATGIEYREVSALATALEGEGLISMDLLQRCRVNPGR